MINVDAAFYNMAGLATLGVVVRNAETNICFSAVAKVDEIVSPLQAKMKAITDEADKRIHPILGDPLFQQYQDWRTKNMQQMRSGKPANG